MVGCGKAPVAHLCVRVQAGFAQIRVVCIRVNPHEQPFPAHFTPDIAPNLLMDGFERHWIRVTLRSRKSANACQLVLVSFSRVILSSHRLVMATVVCLDLGPIANPRTLVDQQGLCLLSSSGFG